MIRASSGAKSAAIDGRQVLGDVLLELFSPAAPAGSALQAAVAQVAMTRSTEVKYSLNDERSGARVIELGVEAGGLAGARADEAVRPAELDLLEVARRRGSSAAWLPSFAAADAHQDDVVVGRRRRRRRVVDVDVVEAVGVLRGERRGATVSVLCSAGAAGSPAGTFVQPAAARTPPPGS